MALDAILVHIEDEAKAEAGKIIQKAVWEQDKILKQAGEEAEKLYRQILDKEKRFYENRKKTELVNAHLESRKELLSAKQELIKGVFNRLMPLLEEGRVKKQQVYADKTKEVAEDISFYITKLNREYETEVAKILFGQ